MKRLSTLFPQVGIEHFLNRRRPQIGGHFNQAVRLCSSQRTGRGVALAGSIPGDESAFTLAEVVVSLAISTLLFSGVVLSYIQSAYRSEWTGYSLAAQALAIQQVEQARSAVWDPTQTPVKNELTNLITRTSSILDIPISGTNIVWATNYATVQSVAVENSVGASVYKIRVDTVWPFLRGNQIRYYTNTVVNYFAPE